MDNETKLYINSKFEVVIVKLTNIDEHLARQNGTIKKHDDQIQEALQWRAKKYAQVDEYIQDLDELKPKVRKLEDNQLTSKSIKRWLIGSVAVMGTLVAVALAVFNLIQQSGG